MSSQVEEIQQQQQQQPAQPKAVSEAKLIDRSMGAGAYHRQTSAGSGTNVLSSSGGGGTGALSTTPVQAVTAYLKNLLGLNAKPTKRSLSEEAECGSPDSLREWLRLGSDPNEVDAYGYRPLVNACLRGCKKSVTVLIANGADVNAKAMHGYTPLHAAAQNGFVEIVELLLDHGADMEAKNDDGDTALMLAVRSDHPEVVDALCKRGCDMHTHGFDNIEPIDYALSKRNLYLSDVLMKHERQQQHVIGQQQQPHQQSPAPSSPSATTAATAAATTTSGSPINRRSLTGQLLHEQDEIIKHRIIEETESEPSTNTTIAAMNIKQDDQEIPAVAVETIFQAE